MLGNVLRPVAAGNGQASVHGGGRPTMTGRCAFLDAHVFVHTHIEKTAGSALVQGLAAIVGWAQTVDVRVEGIAPATEMTAEERALTRLYSGHFNHGVHAPFAQRPLYIAAVRQPADRAVSYYRYGVERTGHPNHKLFSGMDFAAAFDHMDRSGHAVARNGQVQRVMGSAFRKGVAAEEVVGHVDREYFAVVPQQRVGAMINAIRKALDLPAMPLPEFNVGKGPAVDLDPSLKRRINGCNAADVALFIHARNAFKETIARVQDYIAEGVRGQRP